MKTIFLMLTILLLSLNITIKLNAAKTYTGTIVPIAKNTLHSGTQMSFNGTLEHVARVGSVIKPQITNDGGTVIKKGTQLTLLSPDYWNAQVMSAEYAVEAAKANLLTVSENYNRLKYLSKTQSLSIEDYQSVRSNYFASLSLLHEAKANLIKMQQRLDACSIISPFEGIVDKVLFVKGEAALWPKTIIISQLNPIGVNVKMSRDESGKISSTTPVAIIFPNSSKAQGIFENFSILTDDGITFLTSNSPVVNENTKKLQVPVVGNCKEVIRFFIDSPDKNTLAVPVKTLHNDNIGYYVWKAENQRNMRPDKGINSTFHVEKIYVIPDNLQRMHGGFETIQALKNPGTLKEFDIIIAEQSENMKNGALVNFRQSRYTLMPGDKVIVIVGRE